MHSHGSVLKRTRQQHVAQVLEVWLVDPAAAQPELLTHHYTEAGDWEQAVLP